MNKKKIMVVEDEIIIARELQIILESMGYDVCAVETSGEEAVSRVEEIQPDLILMDINLIGEIDGIEAATQIQEKLDIPVVYLTAFGDQALLDRAKVTMPYGYILKPYDDRELRIIIEISLYKHQAEKDRKFLNKLLLQALSRVKTLSGLLPICINCKKIRDDQGYWQQIEKYIKQHSEAELRQSICPECTKMLYSDIMGHN
ncbi:MAG: response regulator [Deltaproteobacteria bacterium]|nr:response regulator [Deltaproteobacteria bacterium]